MTDVMENREADRRAVLTGEVDIYFKEPISYLNEKFEACIVKFIKVHRVAIIEIDGRCYASMPFGEGTLTGVLYETRDSFDELVAMYPESKTGAALEEEETRT